MLDIPNSINRLCWLVNVGVNCCDFSILLIRSSVSSLLGMVYTLSVSLTSIFAGDCGWLVNDWSIISTDETSTIGTLMDSTVATISAIFGCYLAL